MAETQGHRVRVTLRWVQILDRLEPFFKEKGEFRFSAKVSSENSGGIAQETKLPEKGHYEISDNPAWNRLGVDKVLFDGVVEDHMLVEVQGEEIDFLSANDRLESYSREFRGEPTDWAGVYLPGDEGAEDPENLANWRLRYDVEVMN